MKHPNQNTNPSPCPNAPKPALILAALMVFVAAASSQPAVTITSFTRNGVLSWTNTNTSTGGVCTVQVKESLTESWRMAPYSRFGMVRVTGNSGSLDLPLAHECMVTNAPDDVVSAGAAFFRLLWSPVEMDLRAEPTINRVIVVNRSSSIIFNIQLSMVGGYGGRTVPPLLPNTASPPLEFYLPEHPDPCPISWSDYVGSYNQNGQAKSIFVVGPPTDLRIIIGDTRYYLW